MGSAVRIFRSSGISGNTVRQPIADFLATGPLPSEDQSEEDIEQAQRLLERVEAEAPLTDVEAQALVAGFGPDECFGLAWALLHVIETAPGIKAAAYPASSGNYWIDMLRRRAECAPWEETRETDARK